MNRVASWIDYLFTRQRWLVHFFFWLFILLFYVVFFGRRESNYIQTFFFVGLLLPVTIGATYLLNYFLIPRYLMTERFGLFALYFIYVLIGSLFMAMMIAVLTFIVMAGSRTQAMSPASFDLVFLLTSLLVVVFLAVAIKMVLHWRQSREDYQKLMREKVEAELKFLKLQLNPHFLFNTLNNLYYLASEKSDKAPGAIMALSQLLDFVIHQTKSEFIALEDEIKLVKNYSELESLRFEDRLELDLFIDGAIENKRIGPMMLLTLIENAFKHGVMKTVGRGWIRMNVIGEEDRVSISISNSFVEQTDAKLGIGLQNLQSQLILLYPEHHTFMIDKSDSVFTVTLELRNS